MIRLAPHFYITLDDVDHGARRARAVLRDPSSAMSATGRPHGSGGVRETFASRFGALMTIIGVALGLGNVWRFPYMVGKFGGAAFVLFYVLGRARDRRARR